MPRGDGTGPQDLGPMTGRKGRGQNYGRGRNQGMRPGAGPGGNCVCPQCKLSVPHQLSQPCTEIKCPKCGQSMVRG